MVKLIKKKTGEYESLIARSSFVFGQTDSLLPKETDDGLLSQNPPRIQGQHDWLSLLSMHSHDTYVVQNNK